MNGGPSPTWSVRRTTGRRAEASQRTERRLVEPYGLAGGQDHWYLMAWCRLRGGGRSFRLDRMQGARVTDERAPERELHEVAGEIASFARCCLEARFARVALAVAERRAKTGAYPATIDELIT